MKRLLAVAIAVVTLSPLAMADGLEVGSRVGAFYVKDVTGPAAGEKLCYRCRFGDRPTISIFTRDVNADVEALIQQVDGVVGQNKEKNAAAFVVLLSDDGEAKEADLKKIAEGKKLSNTPLTTFDGLAGPPTYKIAQDSDVTVMMWVGGKLKVNDTFKSGELDNEKISGLLKKTGSILE